MNGLWTAMGVEFIKIRRSTIWKVSLFVCILLPLMVGLIASGLTGTKTAPIGHTLQAYLDQMISVVSIGGLIGYGFLFSWVFGREYSDRTVKDLLALPVSRYQLAVAKLAVTFIWSLGLAVLLYLVGCLTAKAIRLDGWSTAVIADNLPVYSMIVLMVISLSTLVSLSASIGKGYLSSIGFLVLTLVASQFGGALGVGEYFPWAVPGLYSGANGEAGPPLSTLSLSLPFLTGCLSLAGILGWWRYADQS